MAASLLSPETAFIQVKDQIEYPQSGVVSKAIFKDDACKCSLFCLAANTEVAEHTATRNATIYAIALFGNPDPEWQKNSVRTGRIHFYGSQCTPCPGSKI